MRVIKDRRLFGERTRVWWLCILGVMSIWTPRVCAEAVDFAQRLEGAIREAESELSAEKARIEKEEQAREGELEQARSACRELADEIVERKISIARKQAESRAVRKQREGLWAERTQWQEDLSQIRLICAEVEKELTELVTSIPVSESRRSQLEQLGGLKTAFTENEPGAMIESVFAVVASLLTGRSAACAAAAGGSELVCLSYWRDRPGGCGDFGPVSGGWVSLV